MSFKNFINFLILINLFSCGVKSDPVHPKGTGLPSVIDEYTKKSDPSLSKQEEEEKNKKNKTQ